MGTHKNTTQNRIFVVILTVLYILPGDESGLWERILLKNVCLCIACGNLMVNVDQQRNVQRLTQKKTCSVLTGMIYLYCCVTIFGA
jgi:hypothetical protein